MSATISKNPTHYRDVLRRIKRDESAGRDLDVRQQLIGLGFATIDELEACAQQEEESQKPQRLSKAELELAKAQNLLEQSESAVATERQRFTQIERCRAAIFEAEGLRARLPSAGALKTERETVVAQIVDQFVEDLKSGGDPYSAGRMNQLMGRLLNIDVTLEILKPAAAEIDRRVRAAEDALAELPTDPENILAVTENT